MNDRLVYTRAVCCSFDVRCSPVSGRGIINNGAAMAVGRFRIDYTRRLATALSNSDLTTGSSRDKRRNGPMQQHRGACVIFASSLLPFSRAERNESPAICTSGQFIGTCSDYSLAATCEGEMGSRTSGGAVVVPSDQTL